MKIKLIATLVLTGLMVSRVYAYGPAGHSMVGAIADEKLAGTPTGRKVSRLLGGVSLADAALLPDRIKGWDGRNPGTNAIAHLTKSKNLGKQFFAFWQANPVTTNEASQIPSHHWFHYTDVPVLDPEKYADGPTGRKPFDIVHMIPFCIRVLTGEESSQNSRKITKPVALALLAHYVGDIHQPLHVGAEYFDATGQPVDPDRGAAGTGDHGGGSITLVLDELTDHGHRNRNTGFHHYWDSDTVTSAFDIVQNILDPAHPAQILHQAIAHYFATREPANWKLGSQVAVKDWAEKWADEVLPIARLAHQRVEFFSVQVTPEVANGFARPKLMPDGKSYPDWAGGVVKDELHKAGWRLADLLEHALK
ncbi:MAG: S1/P1 nuclease [Verrucomicrobia bacterium]|nr:S1/P1 nuclease [Verrucomicrobiota bacterium]